eukprot:45606-Eustigmatos_ZCMA.PRE.1
MQRGLGIIDGAVRGGIRVGEEAARATDEVERAHDAHARKCGKVRDGYKEPRLLGILNTVLGEEARAVEDAACDDGGE